jgi:hypothetical protein
MRTTAFAVTVAGLANAALVSAPDDAAARASATSTSFTTSTTEHQRGVVLECTGSNRAHTAYVDLYENNLHGNYVQVVLDGNPKLAATRQPADIWNAGDVRTHVTIRHQRARILGTAPRVGRRIAVHETNDDAGNHIVTDGFHRRLADDLVLAYDGHRMRLDCAPAFSYSLDVTTTPTV